MLSVIVVSREDPDPHSQVFRSTNPDESELPENEVKRSCYGDLRLQDREETRHCSRLSRWMIEKFKRCSVFIPCYFVCAAVGQAKNQFSSFLLPVCFICQSSSLNCGDFWGQ